MKRYRNLVFLLIMLLIVISALQYIEPKIGGTLTSLLTSFATIVGVFSVFYEMKRSADIDECNFILESYKHFTSSSTPGITIIYEKLDNLVFFKKNDLSQDDRKYVVEYLQFFEMISSLIVKDIISIKDIDNLYAYAFFIAMNCETIQKMELIPYHDYYEGIFKVYPIWKKYREDNNKSIPFNDTPLIK